jgi:uncharacterized protein YdbL (DUF1318 family)
MNVRFIVTGICIFCAIGCARVRVEAPKEAFKVDISMRLDVYQHVAKDIDSIENIVSGAAQKPAGPDIKSSLNVFVSEAYAQEGLGSDVEQAALRRRDRKPQLTQYESSGCIGENGSGLVEIRSGTQADAKALVSAENADRMIIYAAVAQKNGTSLAEVQNLYAKRLQGDAPAGTPIEVGGAWKIK